MPFLFFFFCYFFKLTLKAKKSSFKNLSTSSGISFALKGALALKIIFLCKNLSLPGEIPESWPAGGGKEVTKKTLI